MAIVFKNNSGTTITDNPLTNAAVTINVTDGSLLPAAATGGDWFYATLVEGSTKEIVKVTNRSGNVLTVTRGQEGTSGVQFSQGSRIEVRITNQGLEDLKSDAFYRMFAIQNEEGAIGHGI